MPGVARRAPPARHPPRSRARPASRRGNRRRARAARSCGRRRRRRDSARGRSRRRPAAATPSASCEKPVSSRPNSGDAPSSARRSRITASVRNCGTISGSGYGSAGVGAGVVADRRIDETAIRAIPADRRIRPAGREQPVDDAVILEHLLAARLDALAARAAERRRRLLDQPEIDAAPGKVDRERQPRCAGAADQHVGRSSPSS